MLSRIAAEPIYVQIVFRKWLNYILDLNSQLCCQNNTYTNNTNDNDIAHTNFKQMFNLRPGDHIKYAHTNFQNQLLVAYSWLSIQLTNPNRKCNYKH